MYCATVPSKRSHLGAHQAHDLVEQDLGSLGPEPLADRGRTDDVGEEHGDDPALACNHRHSPKLYGVGAPP